MVSKGDEHEREILGDWGSNWAVDDIHEEWEKGGI